MTDFRTTEYKGKGAFTFDEPLSFRHAVFNKTVEVEGEQKTIPDLVLLPQKIEALSARKDVELDVSKIDGQTCELRYSDGKFHAFFRNVEQIGGIPMSYTIRDISEEHFITREYYNYLT